MNFLLTFVVVFVTTLVVTLPVAFLTGWLLMLAIGIIHLHVLPAVLPVGYWLSVVLAWLLGAVFRGTTVQPRS